MKAKENSIEFDELSQKKTNNLLDKYQVIFIHKQVSFFCHPTVTQKRLNLFSLFFLKRPKTIKAT